MPNTTTKLQPLTLAQVQGRLARLARRVGPRDGHPADAQFYESPDEPRLLGCDADGCEPGRKHPHVWCPELAAWDML